MYRFSGNSTTSASLAAFAVILITCRVTDGLIDGVAWTFTDSSAFPLHTKIDNSDTFFLATHFGWEVKYSKIRHAPLPKDTIAQNEH